MCAVHSMERGRWRRHADDEPADAPTVLASAHKDNNNMADAGGALGDDERVRRPLLPQQGLAAPVGWQEAQKNGKK